jgi:predicted solute-binding protein
MIRTVDIDVAAYSKLILKKNFKMVDTKSGKILFDIDITNDELDDYYQNSQYRAFKEEIDKIKKLITNRKREKEEFETDN